MLRTEGMVDDAEILHTVRQGHLQLGVRVHGVADGLHGTVVARPAAPGHLWSTLHMNISVIDDWLVCVARV